MLSIVKMFSFDFLDALGMGLLAEAAGGIEHTPF